MLSYCFNVLGKARLEYSKGASILEDLRRQLVEITLTWERAFGNAPSITSALSEHDAAVLLGCPLADYSTSMRAATAVQRGYDFVYRGLRYQVKGNRPSGKRGSAVTWVPKPRNYDWDRLIWILYNPAYEVQEAWLWEVEDYKLRFDAIQRLGPAHMRLGKPLDDLIISGDGSSWSGR